MIGRHDRSALAGRHPEGSDSSYFIGVFESILDGATGGRRDPVTPGECGGR